MTTWVYLLIYLLFVINLPPLKVFDAERAVFRTASVINTDLKSSHTQKKNIFLFKKSKKKGFQHYLADTRSLKVLQYQYNVSTLYRRWFDVEEAKGLIGNFMWLSKIKHWKNSPIWDFRKKNHCTSMKKFTKMKFQICN